MRIDSVACALLTVVPIVMPAAAQDRTRVDLYDAKSRREGYAIIDRENRRVDTFDTNANRTGYGKIAPDGRVDLYKLDGSRRGSSVPLQPRR